VSGAAGARVTAAAFGRLATLALPGAESAGGEPPTESDRAAAERLAETLLPEERAYAHGLEASRRVTWVGGRVALRAALAELGLTAAPLLTTPRGAPVLPAGVAASVAHKRSIAVALAAPAPDDVTLGVDVEIERAPRFDISARVLSEAERRGLGLDALPPAARALVVLAAFAAKEAIYKALDPWLRRYVSFLEVELAVGARTARFTPRAGEPSFDIELHAEPLPGHVLMTARVQRRGG
jgi:4'-phosphopantetheinyl transferase EntD